MQQPALGGIYSPHTPKEPLGKADKIPERRLNRRSSFVTTGSTGECNFPATSRYCSNGYLINCTDALEFLVGLTGECKFRNPPKNGVSGQLHRHSPFLHRRFNRCLWVCLHFKSLHRHVVFRHRRFIRRKTLASASGSIAPTYSTSLTSVQPVKPEFLVCSKSMHRRM